MTVVSSDTNKSVLPEYVSLLISESIVQHVHSLNNISEIESDSDFIAEDFYYQAIHCIENVLKYECVLIIVGGSNSYIEKLVEDPVFKFKYKYDSFFIWIDVVMSVLRCRVRGLIKWSMQG